ncbi:unnamed protein product [Albugo candida]|uniref:Hexose transporter 1 n=1 Tax=Albugo candida TaxID=65357 RepID=A0A024GP78_9STRA|nr:unnamed protein product [Albugo candida]|eukprot:CCI48594.1 unnamed protein product [Albugo candida]
MYETNTMTIGDKKLSAMHAAQLSNYMQHSQSEVALGTQNGSWADLKHAESLKKRSNTAQNLLFYVEEQKRLYQELPFMAIPGLRRHSFQRERKFTNLKSRTSWGSFTNLVQRGEEQPLLSENEFLEPGYTWPLLSSCCVALMSAFQFGYNTGVTGAINPDIVFPGHTAMEWAITVSIFAIGGPIGSISAGHMSTTLGRKKALLIGSVLFVLAGLIMALACNIYMLIIGRFVVGFASGAVSVVVPLYLGELAPPNLRGALGTGYQFAMVIGILAADILAFGYSAPSEGVRHPGWRVLMGFTLVPAILQILLSSLLTESPRWLLSKNKPKEAAEILRRLRGTNDVYEEIDSICSASDNESSGMGFWAVLKDTSVRNSLIIGIALQLAQQFSGINAVMYYASSFFKNVGLQDPLVGATLVGAINVISTGVALVLMDTAGRRPLLIYSAGGMILSSFVLTLGLLKVLPFTNMVSVGGVLCFVWFFEIGLGPIPWLIVAEMCPPKPRPTAMSLATMVNWLSSFIVGLVFPTLQIELDQYSFVPFGVCLVFSLLFILKYVPETKGKTVAEIQMELQEKQLQVTKLSNNVSGQANVCMLRRSCALLGRKQPFVSHNCKQTFKPSLGALFICTSGVTLAGITYSTETQNAAKKEDDKRTCADDDDFVKKVNDAISSLIKSVKDEDLSEQLSRLQRQLNDFLSSGRGGQVSFGFLMGVCSGLALKKLSKVGAIALGALFVLLQCASYSGYVDVNYKKMERDMMQMLDLNKDGQFDAKDINEIYQLILRTLQFNLPAGSGFAIGFAVGFRSGKTMGKDVEFLLMENVQNNAKVIEFCHTSMCVVSGCISGIIGLTGLTGFAFMLMLYIVTDLAILLFKMKNNLKTFYNGSLLTFLFDGIFSHGLSFILFWTLAYGLHKYVDDIADSLEFQETIGSGHFGCVKRAISRFSGKEWAVKVVQLQNTMDKESLKNELDILKRLHHPHIVRVIGSCEDSVQLYMIMQLCRGKSLFEHLYQEKRIFTEDEVKRMIRCLLRAIAFLHSNLIIHRDLKLENLLLEQSESIGTLKLCDFGLSTRFKKGEKLVRSLGTIDYIAPEVLEGEYTEKCDLWSVGVICYELLTGISPFRCPTTDETMKKIFDPVLIFHDSIWKKYSSEAICFIKALVREDIHTRLSAEQALEHKWLQETLAPESEEAISLAEQKRILLGNMLHFSACRKIKQTALLSVALGISEAHTQQEIASKVFHSMDTNKNGTLCPAEFSASLIDCKITEREARDLFHRINQSRTGRINFLEFMAAVMDERDIGQNTMREAFGLLDGEHCGRLSMIGLHDVFKHSLLPHEAKEMIQSVDTNGDGYVNFQQFQELFARAEEAVTENESNFTRSFLIQMTVALPNSIANTNLLLVFSLLSIGALLLVLFHPKCTFFFRRRHISLLHHSTVQRVLIWALLLCSTGCLLLGFALELYHSFECPNSKIFQVETQALARFLYEFCREQSVPYWIVFGTLLFVLRHWTQIPAGDTDSDIAIDKSQLLKQFGSISNLTSGIRIAAMEKLQTRSVFVHYIESRELIQIFFTPTLHGPHADMWLYHQEIDHVDGVTTRWMVHTDRTIRAKRLPYDQIFPLLVDESLFLNTPVNLPRNATYLAQAEYGSSFIEPLVTRLECMENVWNGFCFYKDPTRFFSYGLLFCILTFGINFYLIKHVNVHRSISRMERTRIKDVYRI